MTLLLIASVVSVNAEPSLSLVKIANTDEYELIITAGINGLFIDDEITLNTYLDGVLDSTLVFYIEENVAPYDPYTVTAIDYAPYVNNDILVEVFVNNVQVTEYNKAYYITDVSVQNGYTQTTYNLALMPPGFIHPNEIEQQFSPKRMLAVQSGDLGLELNLLYDNFYNERVLRPGKRFIVEVIAKNNSLSDPNSLCLFVAMYGEGNRLIDLVCESATIEIDSTETVTATITVPVDQEGVSAKIFL